MRNIITILFGLFSLINLGAQEVVGNPIYEFATGKYSMLDSPVNIRSQPNLTGSVVGRLELHSEIEILENTRNSQIIEGMTHYWYKIQYGNITGYIWGGYISIRAFSFNNYGNNIKCYYRVSNRKKFEIGPTNGIQYSIYFDSILPNDLFIYINNRRILVNEIHGIYSHYGFNEQGGSWYTCVFLPGETNEKIRIAIDCWDNGNGIVDLDIYITISENGEATIMYRAGYL